MNAAEQRELIDLLDQALSAMAEVHSILNTIEAAYETALITTTCDVARLK